MKERKEREPIALINDRIRASQVQVIDQDGENIGVVPRFKALQLAQDQNLDLVQIADLGKDGVPVTKIMNFGKMLYEKKKKQNEAKKHQKVIQVKEIKIAPKIGEHDFITKMRHSIEFLQEGKRVKMTIFFRGRENVNREERGKELYDRIDAFFGEQDFAKNILHEADSRLGSVWSRIYFLKK